MGAGALKPRLHAPARRSEFDRVRDQVQDRLLQAVGVAGNQSLVLAGFDNQVYPFLLGRRTRHLDCHPDEPAEIERPEVERHLAGDYPRNVEQVADKLDLGLDGALDLFDGRVAIFRTDLLSAQHTNPAQHRRERRTKFVRKQGQKLVLRAVRMLRLASRRIFTLEEPFALLLGLLALGDVEETHYSRDDPPTPVADRGRVGDQRAARAVAAQYFDLLV